MDYRIVQILPQLLTVFLAQEPFTQDSELYSAFGQFTFNVSDEFRIMAGLRRSKTRKIPYILTRRSRIFIRIPTNNGTE